MEDNYLIVPSENTISKFNLEPSYNLCFRNETEQIGRLDWGSGKLVFVGNAEESAMKLFDWFKHLIDVYIQNERNNQKEMDINGLAHKIWATAHSILMPGEGIEDGVDRIIDLLKENINGC